MDFVKITEQSSLHDNLDQKSVGELLREMNEEDQKVALAVRDCIPQIEKLVEGIVERMQRAVVSSIWARVLVAVLVYWMPARSLLLLVCRLHLSLV